MGTRDRSSSRTASFMSSRRVVEALGETQLRRIASHLNGSAKHRHRSSLSILPHERCSPPYLLAETASRDFLGGKKKLRHLLQVAAVLQSSCPRTAVRAPDSRRLAADECPELMRVCVSGTTNGANGQCERDVFRSQSVRCRLSFSVVSRAWAYFFFLPPFFSLMNRPISGSFRG